MPEKVDINIVISEIVKRLNEINIRIIGIEDKLARSESETKESREKLKDEIKKIEDQIKKIEETLKVFGEAINLIGEKASSLEKEIKNFAYKHEVEELKSYIDIWNPLKTSFVTKEEVKKIIEEYLENKQK